MCGNAVDGYRTKGNLEVLDLRNANIVSGGNYYLTENSQNYYTAKNEIPERAFYNCRTLRQLYLPESITTIHKGAFALCNRLDTIYMPSGDDKNYLLEGPALFDKNDTTLLISVLPTAVGTFEVKKGTTVISDYGLAGCTRLHEIILPSSLTLIGHYGFYQSYGLMKIRCYSREPVNTGGNLFTGIRSSACYLYVPAGSKEAFSYHSEWGFFAAKNHIVEFGSAVKARNAGRDYGEPNPVFGYQISGERPNGVPMLSCDAQIDSPVGEYVIHVEPGTITDEIVEFIDGTLVGDKKHAVFELPKIKRKGEYTAEVFDGQKNMAVTLTFSARKNTHENNLL